MGPVIVRSSFAQSETAQIPQARGALNKRATKGMTAEKRGFRQLHPDGPELSDKRTFREPAISPSPRQPRLPLMGALEQVFLLRDRFAERAEKRGKL